MAKRAVIIVAGGTGTRMNLNTAKQFLPLAEKPVLLHTFEAFRLYDPELQFILVLYKSLHGEWKKIQKDYGFDLEHTVVEGGKERFHSVKSGIAALADEVELVAIHDAVRPFVSADTIERCFNSAAKSGAAIPAVPVTDTIRRMDGDSSRTIPRNELVAIQTPQCFKTDILKKAYQTDYQSIFTDDASVVEYMGQPVEIVEGNRRNIKITTREDLLIANSFLKG
ncbi:MAG TPA: 2-C-methyl-D-erythritol 4-phosphate cytidylyltransferase [Cryomorphaceae bacterium]|nr:2-C-methyl-D-erythritol 4-phosphate cytidylyltransferase [Cryomorphaceae bacterium]